MNTIRELNQQELKLVSGGKENPLEASVHSSFPGSVHPRDLVANDFTQRWIQVQSYLHLR